jgi:SdiA-regulated
MKKKITPLLLLFIAVALCSCNDAAKSYSSPQGYNLANPVKKPLPDALLEISGISFGPGSNDSLYAVNDEDGSLFSVSISKTNTQYSRSRFAKSGDYEDLAFYHGKWVVLKSNGTLLSFSPYSIGNADSIAVYKDMLPQGEYESMAVAGDTLYVLCKSCAADDKKESISAYAIAGSGGSLAVARSISIPLSGITKDKAFRPSAMALNPVSGNWFIVSAVNKKLVELNRQFDLAGVHHLKASLFKQPEGMAFDNAGTLYISNEGGDERADLLVFSFKHSEPGQLKK